MLNNNNNKKKNQTIKKNKIIEKNLHSQNIHESKTVWVPLSILHGSELVR